MKKTIQKWKNKLRRDNIKYNLRMWKRSLRFFKQRMTRGWDDSETWSLDYSLAKLILPRLKRFREVVPGLPNEYDSMEAWQADLDKMIAAFEFASSEERWGNYDKEKWERANEGIELFAKNYFALWW